VGASIQSVAVFGVGLIGGSFAMALRKAGFTGRILGVSSPETIERACELKIIDAGSAPAEAAHSADLIYLAQPILQIQDCFPDLDHWVRPDALVTDAGSTKSAIVRAAAAGLKRCQFLGGHPMAGRERRGVEAADPDLFRGRPYVLTPVSPADMETPRAIELLGWIQKIGAVPVTFDAGMHDQVVAYTSHLPQLAATGLAAMLDGRPEPMSGIFGPALTDSTRLALSPFEIWGDIFATNAGPILEALRNYIATLQNFCDGLEPERMRRQFERARRLASSVRGSS
jgi:prephenate dehydrogenase